MKKTVLLLISSAVFLIILGIVLVVFRLQSSLNPYKKYDLCFQENLPGATSRYTTYTPVRCSNTTVQLGEAIGADYGRLSFDDVDRDGQKEVIIKSSVFQCKMDYGCLRATKSIYKILLDPTPQFQLWQHTVLFEHD